MSSRTRAPKRGRNRKATEKEKEKEKDEMEMKFFSQGMDVEITAGEEEGFQGAYLPAKILEINKDGTYSVQYQSLVSEDDPEIFLVENATLSQLRPNPPKLPDHGFRLFEEVDAFHNDAWWVCVVSGVLKGGRFHVHFRYSDEECEFGLSQLRPHHELIRGNWVQSSLDAILQRSPGGIPISNPTPSGCSPVKGKGLKKLNAANKKQKPSNKKS